jgi:hypothetical protein
MTRINYYGVRQGTRQGVRRGIGTVPRNSGKIKFSNEAKFVGDVRVEDYKSLCDSAVGYPMESLFHRISSSKIHCKKADPV